MDKQEAIARISKVLDYYKPKIEVIKQDTELENSIIKIQKADSIIKLAITDSSFSSVDTSSFF